MHAVFTGSLNTEIRLAKPNDKKYKGVFCI